MKYNIENKLLWQINYSIVGFSQIYSNKTTAKPKLGKLFAIVPILAFFTRILIPIIIPEIGMKYCRQQHQLMFLSTLFSDLPNIYSSFCWLLFISTSPYKLLHNAW